MIITTPSGRGIRGQTTLIKIGPDPENVIDGPQEEHFRELMES